MLLKIGTRSSQLALAQSNWIKQRIEEQHTRVQVEIVKIKTMGDKILDVPLSKIGGKGLFVKEIEEALLSKKIDLAVHSMKDVPALLPEGLILSTIPEREDPHDVLVSQGDKTLDQLSPGSKVGTSSLRRQAQILHLRPDLKIMPLRGNVNTRLKKLEQGEYQAIILAAAGLNRLGMGHRISQIIPRNKILPAIGQGALGLEVRSDDMKTIQLVSFINHKPTKVAVYAERALLKELEGGCQVPIGGFAFLENNCLRLSGLVAELNGSRIIMDEISGKPEDAKVIGQNLGRSLLKKGADQILARIEG